MLHAQSFASLLVVAASSIAVVAMPEPSRAEIRVERVHLERGQEAANVEGTIRGDQIVDYVLAARRGQPARISMTSDNDANYFNILAPGESEVAMFNGSMAENQYKGTLPATGDYKIRVYLVRGAARRNEVAKYRVQMILPVGGETKPTSGGGAPASDALVPGTSYHATGSIPCGMGGGQPTGRCPFGVVREGKGAGVVTVTKPDGRSRAISFENGKPTGCDASQADPGEFRASREGDLNIVRIGQERYEIPDAVIWGG